ncbi:MAG: glycosyltransferase family 9 protein ['Candidatus Kapabacteria' thiocyanatum]|nr:glycosyltransferase family 9 protein ['Candidatus Kapabacteria' thiocyanatum]
MSHTAAMAYRPDCLHFRGDVPCIPHKLHGVHCTGCAYYEEVRGRILIIKLGATGDVIRTTPLLHALEERYPGHEVWWVTESPDVLPSRVHRKLTLKPEHLLVAESTTFDVVINLDKDPHACALASRISTAERMGFVWRDGRPAPADERAVHKFLTGLFDDVNKSNTKSYPQEILEICGMEWKHQEYVMDVPTSSPFVIPDGPGGVVGLNTGCGDRWRAREWPIESWIGLIDMLHEAGQRIVLLGGPAEHERNVEIAERTKALYRGTYPVKQFFGVVNSCDVVVTTVTMALHAAIGLRKHVVLLNNIFNPNEFELYGRGVLLQPERPCHCYFKQSCTHDEYQCMDLLSPVTVFDAVMSYL